MIWVKWLDRKKEQSLIITTSRNHSPEFCDCVYAVYAHFIWTPKTPLCTGLLLKKKHWLRDKSRTLRNWIKIFILSRTCFVFELMSKIKSLCFSNFCIGNEKYRISRKWRKVLNMVNVEKVGKMFANNVYKQCDDTMFLKFWKVDNKLYGMLEFTQAHIFFHIYHQYKCLHIISLIEIEDINGKDKNQRHVVDFTDVPTKHHDGQDQFTYRWFLRL